MSEEVADFKYLMKLFMDGGLKTLKDAIDT
jgi:hypothetical protein